MKYIKKINESYQGDTPIATSITSSSTNDEVAGAKAVYDFNSYSTSEHVVGKWIDGKPLYEKTITDTAPTTSSNGNYVTKDIATGISNVDNAFIQNCFITQGDLTISLPQITNANYQLKSYFVKNTGTWQIINGVTSYSGIPTTITLRYTKTTDSVS